MSVACYNPATGQVLGVERTLLAIYNDLNALSAGQKTAIWNDFTSGNPPKWSLDDGTHADALAAASGLAIDMPVSGGWTASLQTAARLKMVAIYLLDQPLYLVNPQFAPAINVKPYTPNPPG